MQQIIQILLAVLAPLSPGIILTCIVAGIFFGVFYNYRLRLGDWVIFHKLIAGLGFITFVFGYRVATALLTSTTVPNPAGWIGVALIWALFCLWIYIGEKTAKRIAKAIR